MAKQKDTSDVENVENTVTSEENIQEAVVLEEKLVRFRPLKDHKCVIGKVPYVLVKGEELRVPESIAIILSNAEKGFRL